MQGFFSRTNIIMLKPSILPYEWVTPSLQKWNFAIELPNLPLFVMHSKPPALPLSIPPSTGRSCSCSYIHTPSPTTERFFERTPQSPGSIENTVADCKGHSKKSTCRGVLRPKRLLKNLNVLFVETSHLLIIPRTYTKSQYFTASKTRAKRGGQIAAKSGVITVDQYWELCSIRQKKGRRKSEAEARTRSKKGEKVQLY